MPVMGEETDRMRIAYEERVRSLQFALEKRELELGILSEVAAAIHAEDDVARILDVALERILTGLHLQTAWVLMGDEREGELHLAASRGVNPVYLDEIERSGLGDCLCPEVFWSGHRMQVRNTTECPRMPTIVEGLTTPVAHACVPLRFEGRRRGVLNIAARPGELFSEEELRFLETVGQQVCIAVERGAHLRAERLRNQEARAMAAISKSIGSSLDVKAVLRSVGEAAGQLLGADQLYILLGSDPRALSVGHLSGQTAPGVTEGAELDLVALGWRLSVKALTERVLVRMDDRETDGHVNRSEAERIGAASGLVAPLLSSDTVRGLLVLSRLTPHQWTPEELDLAEALASQATVAIENARLYDDARKAYES